MADADDDPAAHVDFSSEERAALAADVDLSRDFQLQVIEMRRVAAHSDYFALLGVPRDIDKRSLKRAYFKLSKKFHPDRYYNRNTGPFGPWLGDVFDAISNAFQTLKSDRARERYLASLTGQKGSSEGSQTREEYAAELFQRACNAETRGDTDEALKLFAAVTRMDPRVRYLGRAARCATSARDLEAADAYSQQAQGMAPDDPSIARIRADVLREMGSLQAAEQVLIQALDIKNENDQLVAELQRDLEEVRAALDR